MFAPTTDVVMPTVPAPFLSMTLPIPWSQLSSVSKVTRPLASLLIVRPKSMVVLPNSAVPPPMMSVVSNRSLVTAVRAPWRSRVTRVVSGESGSGPDSMVSKAAV